MKTGEKMHFVAVAVAAAAAAAATAKHSGL
jgi:hypothetical protein